MTIEEDAGLGSSTNSRVTADAADADVHMVLMSPRPFPEATSPKFESTTKLRLTLAITTACLY